MGMHQEFGKHSAPPGTIYSATNSRLDADGVLVKRGGHVALAATTNKPASIVIAGNGVTNYIEATAFLSAIGSTPCVGTTAGTVFCMVNSIWHYQGRCSSCKPLRKRSGFAGTTPSSNCFSEHHSAQAVNSQGYICFAAINDSEVIFITIESPDGTLLVRTHSSGSRVQVLAVGTTFYVVSQSTTTLTAQPLTPNGTDITFGSSATVGTLTSSSAHWDTSSYDGTNWFIIYQSAATVVTVQKMTGTTASTTVVFGDGSDGTVVAIAGTVPVSIFADSTTTHIWVGWYNNPTVTGAVQYRVYTAALAINLPVATIATAVNVYGPPLFGRYRDATPGNGGVTTVAFVIFRYVEAAGNLTRGTNWVTANTAGTVSSPSILWHVLPISKPDNYNRFWAFTDNGNDNFTSQRAALLRVSTGTATIEHPVIELVSPPMPGVLGAAGPSATSAYFHAIATGSSSSFFSFPFILNTIGTASPPELLARIEAYEYTTSEQSQHVDIGTFGTFLATAGQPTEFPGLPSSQRTSSTVHINGGGSETGFLHPPIIISAANGGAAGTASHSWRAHYEWVDSRGRRHRSAPSAPISLSTVNATIDVDLEIASIELSQRSALFDVANGTGPAIVLSRTLNGGTTYHRVKTVLGAGQSGGFVDITDTVLDIDAADEEILYTDGGVLQNDIAPACQFMTFSEDRLWLGGLWDPRVIQCSKLIIPEEPFQFTDHASFQVILPSDCTGLAYMDGQVVAFADDEIFAFGGTGPNDQGIGEFSSPRRLAQGIGCIDSRSIIETNIGVLFQSKRGIELLPRGFGPVSWVGKAVKDVFQVDGLTEVLGAAVYTGTNNTAHFLVKAPGDASTTIALVYDIERNEWTKDILFQECLAVGTWPDGPVYAAASFSSSSFPNPFLYENASQTGDGAVGSTDYVSQEIIFCRIYPFGSAIGWGSINKATMVLESRDTTAASVTISVQTDQAAVQAPATSWAVTPSATGDQFWREYQIPNNRQCSGITVTLSDSQSPSVSGSGFKFLGLGIEVNSDGAGIRIANANNDERR